MQATHRIGAFTERENIEEKDAGPSHVAAAILG